MQIVDKEKFQQLSDAASTIQLRQIVRTSSGWYFTLSAFLFLLAAFRLPTAWGFGWLLCAIASAAVGIFGIRGRNVKSIILFRTGVNFAIAALSLYCFFQGIDRVPSLSAIAATRLLITSLLLFARARKLPSAPPDVYERVKVAFSKAVHSKPAQTPGLIALKRASGLKELLPNDNAQYDFRLLFDHDLIFLIGINSLGGIHYSPRINCIVPSRTFHVDVVGQSWGGKRSKVNLMLDTDPIHATLEITPEMLQKIRERVAQGVR